MNVVLDQAYPFRIAAIEAIAAYPNTAGGNELRARAADVLSAAQLFGSAAASRDWQAFGIALEILGLLADWTEAVHGAAVDADRFLRACRLRYRSFAADAHHSPYGMALVTALAPVAEDLDVFSVLALRRAVAQVEMPIAVFGIDKPDHFPIISEDLPGQPEEIAVAFLEFTIDGKPVDTVHSLRTGEVHDLDLTIRVSRGPNALNGLLWNRCRSNRLALGTSSFSSFLSQRVHRPICFNVKAVWLCTLHRASMRDRLNFATRPSFNRNRGTTNQSYWPANERSASMALTQRCIH